MLKKVLYAIVIAVVLFIAAGLLLPRNVHVERSVEIQRPAVTVFTVLNTYRTFLSWSPWAERDPAARYEFSGPTAGVGARINWTGDPRLVGSGWQEITASEPNTLVRMRLFFDQQGTATSYFRIAETATGSHLTWGFDTDLVEGQGWFAGLLARYFGLFFDRWVGGDYESGLARLKNLVESMPPADFSDLEVEIVAVEPADILFLRDAAAGSSNDLGDDLAAAYREISSFMKENAIERAAQPLAITRILPNGGFTVEAAIPVILPDVIPNGRVLTGQSPAGRALRVIHRGPYDRMAPTYAKLAAWMAAHGLSEGHVSWEQYVSDPGETPPEALITHIYFLLDDEP